MIHLAAFGGAKTDSTANQNVPAVSDNALTTSANARYICPKLVQVFAAQAMNDTIARARITAPSLRQVASPEIYPINVLATPTGDIKYAYWDQYGPTLQANEEFGVECSNGASTVDFARAAVWFRDGVVPVPRGPRFTVVGISTQTLVQDQWTSGGITLDQVLPVGRYSVIGMHCTVAAAAFARLIFTRQWAWRPGVGTTATVGGFDQQDIFRAGRLGDWGQFDSIAQPLVEIFGTTAGAQTATILLDLVMVSNSVMG